MAETETSVGLSPGDFVSLIISHIEDDAISFWAQLVTQATDVLVQLEEVQDSLEKLSGTTSFLNPNTYNSEKIYFCCYEDGNYYRCRIIAKQGDDQEHFLVHYIDYGNTEVKSYRDIYCLDDKHETSIILPLAHKFVLHNLKVEKKHLDKVALIVDQHFSDDSAKAKLHSHMSEVPTKVVLYDQDMKNVNDMLVKMDLAVKINDVNNTIPTKSPNFFMRTEEKITKTSEPQTKTIGNSYFRTPNVERYQNSSPTRQEHSDDSFMQGKLGSSEKKIHTIPHNRSYNSQNTAVQRHAFLGFSNPLLDSDSEIEKPMKQTAQKQGISPPFRKHKNNAMFEPAVKVSTPSDGGRKQNVPKLNGRSPEEEVHSLKLRTTKLQLDNDYYQKKIEELEAKVALPELILKLNTGDAKVRDKITVKNLLQDLDRKPNGPLVKAQQRQNFATVIDYVKLNYDNLNIMDENCKIAKNIQTNYWDYVTKIKKEIRNPEKGTGSSKNNIGALIRKRNYFLLQFDRKAADVLEFKTNNCIDMQQVITKLDYYLSKLSRFAVNVESDVSYEDICGFADSEASNSEAETFKQMEDVKKTMQEVVRNAKYPEKKNQLVLIAASIDEFLKQKDTVSKEAKMHTFLVDFKNKVLEMQQNFKDVEEAQVKLHGIIEGMPEIFEDSC